MLTRRWLRAGVTCLMALCVSVAVGQSRRDRPITEGDVFDDPGRDPRRTPRRTPTPRQPETYSFSGEYQEMVTLLEFTKPQQKALYGIVQAQDKALARFDKQNEKKLSKLGEKLDQAKNDIARKAIQRQIDLVATNRQRLLDSYRRRAMNLFSPKQKATWASHKLKQIMTEEFSSAGLTGEQNTKVKAICDQAGSTAKTADVQSDQTLLGTVKRTILTSVLDAEQRRRYAEALRQKASTG